MLRERVANNILVFTSELYAQVTAGAVLTPAGAIIIDTMPFPVEAKQIIKIVEERHNTPVRYVINTHYHADHTYGTCFFKGTRVISHRKCYDLLDTRGRKSLYHARKSSRDIVSVRLRLPDIVFDKGVMNIHLGGVNLKLWHTPGHSPDSIVCLVENEQILFAADTLMPVPFFADGKWSDFVASLEGLLPMTFENVIQGHGEVVLRGEVTSKIQDDLNYLYAVRKRVEKVIKKKQPVEALAEIDIEDCGKSRIPLNGLVRQLHKSNVETLYQELINES